ncbi:MAG: cytochrome C oxidase subunit IV family protein [Planctomycetes bacterium]|nr:cytochrome C oxidase subunit IV family protein [Planctomycetota bacterium]
MSSDSHSHGESGHHSHVLPVKLLVGVWAALMVLTVLTVTVSKMNLGAADLAVAMVIALVKATLVALIFMHLLWDKGFHSLLVVGGILCLGLFIGATLFDREHYEESIQNLERDHPTSRRYDQLQATHHGDTTHEGTSESTGH